MTSSTSWRTDVPDPTITELIRVVIVLGALWLSGWALIDDVTDLVNVRRFGEVDGPRWITAMEHLLFNGTLLVGWLQFLGVVAIAVYLPSRPDAVENELSVIGGWLSLGFSVCVLLAQVHRRVGRTKLRSLPLSAWERMLTSMLTGMSTKDREAISTRLLAATALGRQVSHGTYNRISPAVGLLSLILEDEQETPERRTDAAMALAELERLVETTRALHAEIKALENP